MQARATSSEKGPDLREPGQMAGGAIRKTTDVGGDRPHVQRPKVAGGPGPLGRVSRPLSSTQLDLSVPSPRFRPLPQGSSPLPHSLCLALGVRVGPPPWATQCRWTAPGQVSRCCLSVRREVMAAPVWPSELCEWTVRCRRGEHERVAERCGACVAPRVSDRREDEGHRPPTPPGSFDAHARL